MMQDNERRALLLTTSDLKGKAAHISLKGSLIARFAPNINLESEKGKTPGGGSRGRRPGE